MIADWKPIESAPKDRQIMLTDGKRIELGTWAAHLNQYYLDEPTTDEYGNKIDWGYRGGWELNGLTPDEDDRTMDATMWDEMPQLP